MKKVLEKIDKNELIEYSRSSSSKFAVGKYVGKIEKFDVFSSFTPYGENEGYRFIENYDLKEIGKKTTYLKIIEKKINMRNCKRETIVLKKEKFFDNLFKYFIKNKTMLRIFYKNDCISDGRLVKMTKELFYLEIFEDDEYVSEKTIKRSQIKSIKIGKNNFEKIEIEGQEIEKNKVICSDYDTDIQGDIIFQDNKYLLIYEEDLFFSEGVYTLIETDDISEILEKDSLIRKKDILLETIFPNIVDMNIFEILKKCYEERIIINFEYEKSYYEKYGIIEKIDDKKLIFREIGKNSGVFVAKCEILLEDISFIFLKNKKILE